MRRVMRNAAGSITRMNSQDPRVRGTRTRLRETSRVRRLIDRIQAELPDPREAVARAAQDERPTGLDGRDRKSLTASNGDLVTNGQMLKFRQDASLRSGDRDTRTDDRASRSCTARRADTPSARATARYVPAAATNRDRHRRRVARIDDGRHRRA